MRSSVRFDGVTILRVLRAVALTTAASSCGHAAITERAPQLAPVKCVTGNALDVAAPEAIPASALPPDEPDAIHPCKAKTPAWDAASAAAAALGQRVNALAEDGDAKPVKAELDRLLAMPCFELANADPHGESNFDSALSLKEWWGAGGEAWVTSYLSIEDARAVVVSPTRRRSLTLATPKASQHPLAPLLCPAADARLTDPTGCGRESTGWVKRASAAMLRRAGNARTGTFASTVDSCRAEALAKDVAAGDRYTTYRECIETVPVRHDALPLGRFKAPTDGWFVIAGGRRGRCEDLYAYDLATGAAYRVSDCRGRRGTRGPIPFTSSTGRLPLSPLREAVWMILLAQVSEHDVLTESAEYAIPTEVAIQRPPSGRGGTGGFGCGTTSPRAWSWMRSRGGALVGQASGVLQWPHGCEDASGHAVELLEIAEDGFDPACVPAGPPQHVNWSAPGPAIERDHAAVLDDPSLEPLRVELGNLARAPRTACPK